MEWIHTNSIGRINWNERIVIFANLLKQTDFFFLKADKLLVKEKNEAKNLPLYRKKKFL